MIIVADTMVIPKEYKKTQTTKKIREIKYLIDAIFSFKDEIEPLKESVIDDKSEEKNAH